MEKGIFNNTFRNRVTFGVDNHANPENEIPPATLAGEGLSRMAEERQDFSLEIGRKYETSVMKPLLVRF